MNPKTKLWSSRFSESISDITLKYTECTGIDQRMAGHDALGCIAHVIMLSRQKILTSFESKKLLNCLVELHKKILTGQFDLLPELEDIHLNIEEFLIRDLGLEVGGKVHTARSRNDQVITASRMYLREALLLVEKEVLDLGRELLDLSQLHQKTLFVGFTHSQPAQPISFGFWLAAHASALLRDAKRVANAYHNTNQSPLGACALAGTSFNVDRDLTAEMLGFGQVLENALDSTSSRDCFIESASALAMLSNNISRMSEELVVFSGLGLGLISISDRFATGSSIMPQKKNPVVAELARGRSSIAAASLFELLMTTKSLSLGYSCDLQHDKPPMWRAIDSTIDTVRITREQLASVDVNEDACEDLCWRGFTTATELANTIVRESNLSFRSAYSIVGAAVKRLEESERTLKDVSLVDEFLRDQGVHISAKSIAEAVDPRQTMSRQKSKGGTAPEAVDANIRKLSEGFTKSWQSNQDESRRLNQALSKLLEEASALSST